MSKVLQKVIFLIIIVMLSSVLLVACGEETKQSNNDSTKDLPKDRSLVLSNRDGWPDLYTIDLTGKLTGRLTETAAAEYGAVWSPDGRRVAFTEVNGDQATGDFLRNRKIVVMDADGKNRRVVATDGFNPVWSPDGTKILYTRVVPLAGSTERQYSNIPDSQRTTATPSNNAELATAIAGGNLPFTGVEPTPAPIGASSNRPMQASLFIIGVEGNQAQPTVFGQDAISGVWSPDGKRIAYISGNNSLEQKRSLFVANADGSGKSSLTEKAKLNDLDMVYVAWSPDGTTLAFTATDTQKSKTGLYRITPDGLSFRKLTDYDGSSRDIMGLIWAYADFYNPAPRMYLGPAWSPNSRSIAFTDGSAKLSVVDVSSGNTRYFSVGTAALGQDKDAVLKVSWLPDNRRLLYDRTNTGRTTLLSQAGNYIYDYFEETLETLDTANKNTLALLNSSGSAFSPVCCGVDLLGVGSPALTVKPTTTPVPPSNSQFRDGKLIYVSGIGQRQLIVNDLKANTQQVITSGVFKLIDFNPAPSGDKLLYIEVGERFNAALYLATLDGKQKIKLSEGNGNPDELSYVATWSPDGKQVAFQALNDDPKLKSGLYTASVDGNSAPRLITDKNVSAFAWSPDGKLLAYKVDAETYELYIARADGSDKGQKITSVGRTDPRYSSLGKGLAWSPDGRYLAMSGVGGVGYSSMWLLWLITPQGKIEEQPGYYINRIIGFTQDGSRLIATMASSSQRNTIQAYVLNMRSWRSYDAGSGPVVSGDSVSMAFYNRYSDGRADMQSNGSDTLQRMVVVNFSNGFARSVLLEYPPYYSFKARFYAWEPNGKAIAFYQNNTIYAANSGLNTLKPEVLARGFAIDHLAWVK